MDCAMIRGGGSGALRQAGSRLIRLAGLHRDRAAEEEEDGG